MGFSALLPSIMQDPALWYTQAGVLASGFFGAYAAMQLPAGLLGDRFGRRRVLLAGLPAGALGIRGDCGLVWFHSGSNSPRFTGIEG